MKKLGILLLLVLVTGISVSAVSAQTDSTIPPWVRTAVGLWSNGQISDQEFIAALQFFIDNEIITVPDEQTDSNLVNNLQTFQSELNDKILQSRILANNIEIQNAIVESNETFESVPNVESLISQLDSRWSYYDPEDPDSLVYELENNHVSDIIRAFIENDDSSGSTFTYAEIFVTNAYGANVAQSSKTSDFRQDDETWWQEAKLYGIHLSNGGFDESANVYSSDIAIQVFDREGRFIGVLKAVIDTEALISSLP